MTDPWWELVKGPQLAQGDLLPGCVLPLFVDIPNFGEAVTDVETVSASLVIATQSCDLQNNKAEFVACCTLFSLNDFESKNPDYRKKGRWESVRKGREESLYLLGSPDTPSDNRAALVVDLGHIVSLPIAYLTKHAESLGNRWRLRSPYLEHYSQSLARFFMRVGLPSTLPPYN